jgi:hypothetical protein
MAREARAWISHVDQFESSYDACFKSNADFGAKVLGLIDLTFFQLCDARLRAQSIKEVDFSSIVLNGKRLDILQNCFQANKPAYLMLPPKKSHGLEGEELEKKDGKKKTKWLKRGGGKDGPPFRDLGAMVQNSSQQPEWKVQGLKYKQIFTPDLITTTPPFNATGLITCNKGHVQGFCYEKCERKTTHKNFESATHKAAFDKWIKEFKAKNP